MSQRQIQLDLAAFLDSPHARGLSIPAPGRRTVAERLLESCYSDLGQPPAELDGEGLRELLLRILPTRFARGEALVASAPAVLEAFFAHLREVAVVAHDFEQRLVLDDALAAFPDRVAASEGPRRRSERESRPFEHGAERHGRNDPCWCGSGKKFKRCHGRPS